MFDYYAMPSDWPGRQSAAAKPWNKRASHVEGMICADIVEEMGSSFHPKYFISYVQLHEFEALAFANIEVLASVLSPIVHKPEETLVGSFEEILGEAGHPEAINDGYKTCPSRRISGVVPAYRKPVLGPIITGRIGIEILREKCTHFGEWLTRLEQIGRGEA